MKRGRLIFPCLTLVIACVFTLRVAAFEVVVVDPGHGGNDEGTKWYHTAEKELTLAVAQRLVMLLRWNGIPAVQTRWSDTYVSLDDRVAVANRWPNSLLVSIHFNASGRGTPSGFQTYHFTASPSGRVVAGSIHRALGEFLPSRDRGLKKGDYAVLVRANDCAVLVECGFISNRAEAARYRTPEGQQALAEALARGIMRAKPVINHDPPECEDAKCIIFAKKAAAAARKLALRQTAGKGPDEPRGKSAVQTTSR